MIKVRPEHYPLIVLVAVYIIYAITKINVFYLLFCIVLLFIAGKRLLELSNEYQNTKQRPPFITYILILLCLLYGVYGIRITLGI